jgi:hypothetical protein
MPLLAALLSLLFCLNAFSLSIQARAAETELCQRAVAQAERKAGLPPRLLDAISKVESGRRDPQGGFGAWPWTINVAGQGYFYGSKEEAIAAVKDFQAHGFDSIDVGCLQINLHHHPEAFASLEDAFDPTANASYGARFLNSLFDRLHGWTEATAAYHSLTPELGQDYARRVIAIREKGDFRQSFGVTYLVQRGRPFAVPAFATAPRFMRRPPSLAGLAIPAQGDGKTLAAYRRTPVRLAPVRLAWR